MLGELRNFIERSFVSDKLRGFNVCRFSFVVSRSLLEVIMVNYAKRKLTTFVVLEGENLTLRGCVDSKHHNHC